MACSDSRVAPRQGTIGWIYSNARSLSTFKGTIERMPNLTDEEYAGQPTPTLAV